MVNWIDLTASSTEHFLRDTRNILGIFFRVEC